MGENMGNHVTIDLPQDWFEDKDLLGFALFSAYVPLDDESKDDFEHGFEDKSEIQSENESDHDEWAHKSEDESENGSAYKFDNKSEYEYSPCSLECDLTFHGDQSKFSIYPSLSSWCECCENDGASGQTWVLYYPKFAIEKKYHSNTWGRLKASFHGYFNGMPVKVEKCGMQLIYAKNDEYNRPTLTTMPDTWNMECLQKLYLDGTAIKEIPSSIDSLSILVEFYTRNCKNLESLPRSICRLKYLQVLCCTNCSKLGSFPEVMENMNNLRELHLHGTAIQDLPSSIENLKGLEFLDLASCKKLVTLPTHICNLKSLKTLHVYGCSKLNKLPKSLGSLQCLEHLDAGCLGSIAPPLPSLSGLCSLRILHLNGLNLMQWSIQDDICRLYSLEVLDLTNCNLIDDGIADEIFHLSSLQVLLLSRNHISKIPAGISQLSKLQVLGFSHCEMAVEIPELPSSLRSIDVHACTGLKTLSNPSSLFWASLFKCFKSAIQDLECGNHCYDPSPEAWPDFCYFGQGISILIPRSSGIPEWIRHQKNGSRVTIELPRIGQVWVLYYPKVAIKEKYHSNKWRRLKASFHCYLNGTPVKVEKCGMQLIYVDNDVYSRPTNIQHNDSQENLGDQRSTVEDVNVNDQRSCDDAQNTTQKTICQ
ncbi:TMV resistance protein N [Vitis vinifera]|uniref:TMV resistance protein N n=1 Tax=Vitis vinifera TaxID=29760 RepID=A0A438CDC2_VITVI|nr:TMV resistance protein N [Vitis vinifera]